MRKDNYAQAIFDKLRQCAEIAKGYDYTIFLGDIFHRKNPDSNSHALVGGFMDVLRGFPVTPFALVGNHDIRDGNMGCLPEQPLGIIFKSGLLKELKEDCVFAAPSGFVPVQISPLPFSYEAELNPELYECKRRRGMECVIRLTHASILPPALPNKAYMMPHVPVEKIWGQEWDLLVNGHIHHHSDVIQHDGQSFVNIGAIARGSLNSWALEQNPRILGVEIGRRVDGVAPKFTWHDLKVKPPEEVFRVEEALRVKGQKAELADFVLGIKANEKLVGQVKQADFGTLLEEYLTELKVGEKVARKVKELVGLK